MEKTFISSFDGTQLFKSLRIYAFLYHEICNEG